MPDSENLNEEEFQGTPADWHRRWVLEFKAARDEQKKWHSQGEEVVKRYLDEREDSNKGESRRNYFAANVETQMAILFGKTPKASVSRRWSDTNDELARVSAEMLERILNTDIENSAHGHEQALWNSLWDYMVPGAGVNRHLYRVDFEEVDENAEEESPEQPEAATEELGAEEGGEDEGPAKVADSEEVETLYVHWKDQLWSPSKTWHDIRWWAFKAPMSRASLIKRFGKQLGAAIPLNGAQKKDSSDTTAPADPWAKAEVWEIWDKEHEKRFMFSEAHPVILEEKDDPLELRGFFPFQRPMMACLTTSKMVPKPVYCRTEDLYNEINDLSDRIYRVEQAIEVRGAYDASATGLADLLKGGRGQALIPLENWARFAEKGKLEGAIAWLPLEMLVLVVEKLREAKADKKQELFELTGMADILRGQATEEGATATEQRIKAKFGSVRLNALQTEFARFASEGQAIRAEIMCEMFDAETLIKRSNILNTPDAQVAQQAAEFLKTDFHTFRIEIKPESVNLTDHAEMKSERGEVLEVIANLVQMAMPLLQVQPQAMPLVLELMKWMVASTKGSSEIQGLLDKAVQDAEAALQQAAANPQPPQQDPKLQTVVVKNQGDVQKIQAQAQSELVRIQAETQALHERRSDDANITIQEEVAKAKIRHVGELASSSIPRPGPVGEGGAV